MTLECLVSNMIGLHWWVPEGRNISAIKDEEALYHLSLSALFNYQDNNKDSLFNYRDNNKDLFMLKTYLCTILSIIDLCMRGGTNRMRIIRE